YTLRRKVLGGRSRWGGRTLRGVNNRGEVMELQEALAQISEIRQQMARTEVFRGYRALPVAFSGLLAFSAAVFQAVSIPDPQQQISAYLTLWLSAAVVSAAAAGVEMALSCWHAPASWRREITCLAVGQFLPCTVAGGLVLAVFLTHAPECLW